MTRKLCVIPGDGIGPEVVASAVEVLSAVVPDLRVSRADAGWATFQMTGSSVPDRTLAAIKEAGACLFGAVSSPSGPVKGYRSAILRMRQELGLGANIRPIDSRWGSGDRQDIRFTIVRENTEGLYAGRERFDDADGQIAIAERVVSVAASERIAKVAVDVAQATAADTITIVHKANVLPLTDGLFRDCVLQVISAAEKDGKPLAAEQLLVDLAALKLVSSPERFQVIVTTNLFGDILSDLAAYWCGGLEKAPSLNLGSGLAVAEPVHGSAPDIAGSGTADPTAAILSAALLCRLYWNDHPSANRIESAVERSIGRAGRKTRSTAAVTRSVINSLRELEHC